MALKLYVEMYEKKQQESAITGKAIIPKPFETFFLVLEITILKSLPMLCKLFKLLSPYLFEK